MREGSCPQRSPLPGPASPPASPTPSRAALSPADLPVELVLRIYIFLDFSDCLNFSLTNREIAYKSYKILGWHRGLAQRFRTCAPVDLDALYTLAQAVVGDEAVAWHVRAFVNHYDDFKVISTTRSFPAELAQHPGMLLNDLCNNLRQGRTPATKALLGIARGSSEILKLLLLALCPRLTSLSFRNFPETIRVQTQEATQWWNHRRDGLVLRIPRDYPEHYFSAAVRNFARHGLGDPPWPLGFANLRKITIGDGKPNRTAANDILPLLRLPNLYSLRVRGLRLSDTLDGFVRSCRAARRKWGPARVQHLHVDRPASHYAAGRDEDVLESLMSLLWLFPLLRTLVLTDAEHLDLDRLSLFLARNHARSLDTWLTLPGRDPDRVMNRFFYADRGLTRLAWFVNLRVLVLDVVCFAITPGNTAHDPPAVRPTNPGLRSLELLVFDSSLKPLTWRDTHVAHFAGILKDMVDERWSPRLKTIYLDKVADAWQKPRTSKLSDAVLRGLMRACSDQGIKVYWKGETGATDECLSAICSELFVE